MEGTNAMNASPYVAISLSFLLLQPRINLAGHQLAVGNSWLWSVDGVKVLVDPIIEGPLDFGIPWLYTGYKKVLKSLSLDDVIDTDVVLITQSLDDHMHVRTLKALAARRPDVPVIATPNGQAFLDSLFSMTLKALAARRPDVPVIATPNGQAFLDSLFSNVSA
ncbi:unnamed protein product [Closterium sp. NIES-64]|nr:unnamed protein product [Closterium sp. NIES-64]